MTRQLAEALSCRYEFFAAEGSGSRGVLREATRRQAALLITGPRSDMSLVACGTETGRRTRIVRGAAPGNSLCGLTHRLGCRQGNAIAENDVNRAGDASAECVGAVSGRARMAWYETTAGHQSAWKSPIFCRNEKRRCGGVEHSHFCTQFHTFIGEYLD